MEEQQKPLEATVNVKFDDSGLKALEATNNCLQEVQKLLQSNLEALRQLIKLSA